ncbi:TetR family transcriptional regulator [Tsukamurella soli]|uniref:TetR family transcriptional regulator n=1 Tax=Tsukamurella soli TaxID=644556 RepID=UPI0036115FD3
MLPRDADATRARLVGAATAEFAECGIAGARVDRIAAAARANKAQIYHYFGSKQGLFAAVLSGYAERASASDYFDADDLPGTAAAIFDQFEENPELARLTTWYRLEAGAPTRRCPRPGRRTTRRSPPSPPPRPPAGSPMRCPRRCCWV